MRRSLFLILILTFALAFALSACNTGNRPSDNGEIPGAENPQEKPTENDICSHVFSDWIVEVEPSCVKEGLIVSHCTLCKEREEKILPTNDKHNEMICEAVKPTCDTEGRSESTVCIVCGQVTVEAKIIAALGHIETVIPKLEATCTEKGQTLGIYCTRCDQTILAPVEIEPHGHNEVIDEKIEPTCTETGLTEGVHCSVCKEILVHQSVVSVLGHDDVIIEDTAPTCTESGLTLGVYCTRCNETLIEQTVIPALGHEEVIDKAVAPTCTETGLAEGKHCGRCKETLVAQNVVAALGHVEVIDNAVAPTCTETGLTEGKHCDRCKEILVAQNVVSALGHVEVTDKAVASTCTETGLTEGKHCDRCKEILTKQDIINALGHYKVIDKAAAPTCTETGLTEGMHCDRCKEILVAQNAVDALGHVEVIDKAVAPTCTITGLTEGKHCDRCGETLVEQNVVSALGHILVVDEAVPPTCTETGLTEGKHCERCNEIFVQQNVVSSLGHIQVTDEAVAPTCTGTGLTFGIHCDRCNEILVVQKVVDALGHTETIDKAVAPTCTKTGLTEGKHCSVCGEMLVKQSIINALGHTETIDKAVAPTCTETGLTEGVHCSVCGETLVKQNVIDALGHTEITDKAVAPTCTEAGLTEGKHCSVCGETLIKQNVIDALGHTEITDKAVAPTCTEAGLTEGKHCSVCGEILFKQNVVDALGHVEVIDSAVAPTCIETGLTEGAHCDRCKEILTNQDVINALGHVEVIDNAVAPTCTETGLTEGMHCDRCKEILVKQNIVDALGHVEVIDSAIAPTCTDTGLTEGKHCSVCGETLVKQDIVDALGHVEVIDNAVAPTCTETGLTEGKHCSVCGETLVKQNVVDALGHVEVIDSAVAPTCTETGLTEGMHCSVCGEILVKQNIVDALGHVEVIDSAVAPTCTDTGLTEGMHCSRCNSILIAQKLILANGHDYETLEEITGDCTTDGYKACVCRVCSGKAIQKTNAPGHTITEYDVKISATCELDGEAAGYCDVCSEYVTIIIPAIGHTPGPFIYEDGYCGEQRLGYFSCVSCHTVLQSFGHTYDTVSKDPTCTEDGQKTHVCRNCGDSYVEIIKAKGHIGSDWKITENPTCKTEGVEAIICITCNAVIESREIAKISHSYESSVTGDSITYTCSLCADSYSVSSGENITVSFVTVLDGVSCLPLTVSKGVGAALPSPTKDGYSFNGWFFDSEFKYKCPDNYTFESDVTLYASWSVSTVSGSVSTENIVTGAPVDFTFKVMTTIALSDANITDYVSVHDTNGKAPKIYISHVDGNVYTVASDEYLNGMGYEAVTRSGVTLVGTDANHLMFVIEKNNTSDIIYRDGIVFISEKDVFAVYETEDGRIYFFFRTDLLDVNDVAVIYGDGGISDILVSIKVLKEGSAEGAYVYEAEAASPEDVFDECNVYFSGDIETDNLEFTANLEEEIVKIVEESALYAQMRAAARKYAKGFEAGDYYYEFSDIKVVPTFTNDKNSDKITIGIEIVTEFERLHTETRVVESILAITLKVKSVFTVDAVVNVSGVKNFTLILNVDNSTSIDLYVSRGTKNESKVELSYFKELFLKSKEDGAFEALDSSSASKSREITLGKLVFSFGGVSFNVELSNVFSFEAVGQLGMGADIKLNIKAGVQCRNGDLSAVKSFNAHSTLNFYMIGKVKLSDTVKLKASASFLGVVNAYVEIQASPYFEMGGTAQISIATGGGFSANIGGYVEVGVNVNASAGVNAKISYWRLFKGWKTTTLFDKSWVLYKESFVLFEIGDEFMTLYFTDKEEDVTISYVCGQSISLSNLIDRTVVQQNLKTMQKSYGIGDCLYYIESGSVYVTLTEDGMLTVVGGNYDSITITVRVEHKNVFKTLNITITFSHDKVVDERIEPTCTKTGLTEGLHCEGCQQVFIARTVIDALGHSVVTDKAVAPTCPTTGLTEGSHCERCGEVFVAQTVIPTLGYHVHVATVLDPTCLEDGYTLHECLCGDTYKDAHVEALGHEYKLGLCVRCGKEYDSYSRGLELSFNENGKYYYVKSIGNCTDTVIDIPPRYNGYPVTSISSNAFNGCYNITSVTIHDTVTSIGSGAFSGCYKLIEVINHSSLNITVGSTSYGYVARYAKTVHSGLSKIDMIDDYHFITIDGVAYLLSYLGDDIIIQLPESYNGEGYSLYDYALYNHPSILSITLPESLISIGSNAMYMKRVAEVINHSSINVSSYLQNAVGNFATIVHSEESKIVNIDDYLFITVNNQNRLIAYIGKDTMLTLPDGYNGQTYVIAQGAFSYNNLFTDITLSECVTDMGRGAFECATALVEVHLPSTLKNIAISAFYGCTSLKSINIPNGVTNINFSAFQNCTSLNNIVISSTVQSIYDYAFKDCSSLKTITFEDASALRTIGTSSFAGCTSLVSITIPEKLTYFAPRAFEGCTSLVEFIGPNTAAAIEQYMFLDCTALKKVTLSPKISTINSEAFQNCTALETIELPSTIKNIYSRAFYGCTSLREIVLPYGIKTICIGTFEGCSSLVSISIPDTVTKIENNAFYGCSSLKSITIPSGVTSIGYSAFCDCDMLTTITIPDGVTLIDRYTFGNCDSLREIIIPSTVTSIGDSAFRGCVALESITLPSGITALSRYMFSGCSSLKSITLPSGITSIGDYAFQECSQLTEIIIPEGVTSIGQSVFTNCTELKRVLIPEGVTQIGIYTFSGCKSLVSIVIPDSVTSIGRNAFNNCKNLVSITLGSSLTSIESSAFLYCNKLTEVINRSSLELTKNSSSNGCVAQYARIIHNGESRIVNVDGLIFVTDDDGISYLVNYIGNGAVLTLPDEYNDTGYVIGNSAFENRKDITTVILGKGVTKVENFAFSQCSEITEVYYCGTENEWKSINFQSANINYLINAKRYYYSESEPTNEGKYWHYDENGEISVW